MKKSLTGFFVCSALFAFGQSQSIEFANPLNIPINASGNFGELRGSHFHSGLDIKTQQRIGLPVYAPADGYVSRIKVSTWGYGKALYIDHPNGMTTVYGHLNGYEGAIAKRVFDTHYKQRIFEIEIFPKRNEIPVKKGDIIAYTGNTGGSGGPHLHYEFRDTKTQAIINPLSKGMKEMLIDTEAPTVNAVYAYPISAEATINKNISPVQLAYKMRNGVLVADPITAKGKISFGIDMHDTANNNSNKNGVYKVETFINGTPSFSYQFDTFTFSETGFVNALVDYGRVKRTKAKVQKMFVEIPYPLSVLKVDKGNQGILTVKPGESYTYKIVASDYHGNQTTIEIPVTYADDFVARVDSMDVTEGDRYDLVSTKEFIFEKDFASVSIPANTFYQDFTFIFNAKDKVVTLHKDVVAGFKNMTLTVDMSNFGLTDAELEKAYLAQLGANGSKSYVKTHKKGKLFTIYTKKLGNYSYGIDTTPPKIYQPSFKEGDWLSNADSISFLIQDIDTGINTIEGSINGKWMLLDYDYKTKKIVHLFRDGVVTSGRNDVVIKVTDNMNNEATYTTHFFRK
ncbi:murein DD-endopeptidase MepM/ murein hydrolase activator NlpD [Myroides gitamensis]|uniref:M23 family metallopeptidase n=1 Tax=Myroides odoratus TaxID=256 RepID=UPI0021695019|nr:M23 family metallopeptidase [Myroides odoratus]MCS4240102.1 murein DD-endopeptidase MepM/ murein hydrolase activator NlpD [Myroides odoratus]MDH6601255.1 murein DD-endopeptidase MepM/ murein hydrolase activator NlpD [Myroides gitamensis]